MSLETEILFSRLYWPSGLARGQALSVLAPMIAKNADSGDFIGRFLDLISRQKLESVAVIGLSVFLKAKNEYELDCEPFSKNIQKAVKRPSLLSHLILKEIVSGEIKALGAEELCSPSAPVEFSAANFFSKYVCNFLPPGYMDNAERFERKLGVPFVRQWSYEWSLLNEYLGVEPSTESFNFWGRKDEEMIIAFDSLPSEIYRSAYLRTLAWAVVNSSFSIEMAEHFAIKTCPFDFGLEKVKVGFMPGWWPFMNIADDKAKINPSQVWEKVNELWEKQKIFPDNLLVGQASGRIYEGDDFYDLEISGFLQKCLGCKEPNLEDIFRWFKELNYLNFHPYNELFFEGVIKPVGIDDYVYESGDWSVLPIALHAVPRTTPKWQVWRLMPSRGIYFPNPMIFGAKLDFACENDGVITRQDSKVVSRWSDWVFNLKEKLHSDLSPSAGEYLLVDRKRVDLLNENNKSIFGWICRLTCYFKEGFMKPYKVFHDYRQYGFSSIIMP